MKKEITFLGIFIWLLASFFYLYEFFLQVFLSTVTVQVMQDLQLDASSYSIMTAGYYLPYSLMQIPVGILIDRFGARYLLTIAIVLASIGVFWFSTAHSFTVGFLSRCFMGFGSSFAYVSLLVLALNWFPKRHFALFVGLANLLGALGPFLAGGPLSYILILFNNDWRFILFAIGCIGLLLSLFVGVFVKNSPQRLKGEIIFLDPNKDSLMTRLKLLVKNPQAWIIVLFSGFVYVSLPLLGAYWGTSYLQAKGLTRTVAASLSSILWVGYAIGAPLSGRISDCIKRRKLPLIFSALIGTIASSLIIFSTQASIATYGFLFFCIGLASAGSSPSFAAISEHIQKNLQATGIGFNNAMITFFAALFPPLVSFLIEWGATQSSEYYSVKNFQDGLFLMPIFYGIAFVISTFLIKETYCRSQHEVIKAQLN